MTDTEPVPCPVCVEDAQMTEHFWGWEVWCEGWGHRFQTAGLTQDRAIARWNRAFAREGRE